MRYDTMLTLAAVALLGAGHPVAAQAAPRPPAGPQLETAVFAGGCFWGVEAVFEHLRGVRAVVSGYTGGTTTKPDYESVSGGQTGHAEAVKVVFDPQIIPYDTLLAVFFTVAHDPTERNRQGPDVGTQYRSAVFVTSPTQHRAVQAFIAHATENKIFRKPIVTEVAPLQQFWYAEAYHQNYLYGHRTQPYIVYHDLPKLAELQRRYPKLWEVTTGK